MKIEAIETFHCAVGTRNQLLVKVITENGIEGWGESGLSSRELAVEGAVKHFSRFLIGKDARQINRLWQECYRSQYFEGGRVLTAAISAIDMALYDILGKSLSVPVYQLLGGKQRDEIPTFACGYSECSHQELDDLILELKGLIQQGFQCVRVLAAGHNADTTFDPRDSLSETADCLVELRSAIGRNVTLGIDFHHRLSIAEAASFCQRMPRGTIDFLEEPLRQESVPAYQSLRTMTEVPFAIGEEFCSKWSSHDFISKGITQFLRVDIGNIGGFTESLKVASLAETHYIDVMPHNPLGPVATAATLHLAAVIPNLSWVETHQVSTSPLGFHDKDLFPQQFELHGSVYKLNGEPGLGVIVNEDLIRQRKPVEHEPPHLSKFDGSFTNW
ncbi:mandelate racemase/muconate lactonizing enzyme family protein [Vibrio ulleungensis]|uniref:Mandelate racemase/muconate lactonizing enzyme family protein n=1 Tax=Vibrio ulleungensis TaxID=2807619 RepID=A0ABS2HFN9_9VIBR|nr:mandelate racemase/muconate lactonizing enzyme family protein [Vibrio ulleungensis]MBM7035212.1 mandelate racemase/muconate lactonizing enzyme family protein [Vibrio ulleungensis]